ncbi:MAG: Ca2+-binding EF-hand superfamily protein, partial [Pirellulaceae bacterium]
SGNASFTNGRDLPWLQDGDANNDGSSDIWLNAWDFAYRDVVILDENNEYVAAYNLTNNDLANPINYATLEQMLVDAGEAIVTTEFEWQNSSNRFDVDADNSVAVIDVLRIVNRINLDGTGELPARTASDEYYFDVSGDGRINAVDVLQLVNEINRSFSGAQGESIDDAAEDELVGSIDLFSSDQVEDSDPLSDDWLI